MWKVGARCITAAPNASRSVKPPLARMACSSALLVFPHELLEKVLVEVESPQSLSACSCVCRELLAIIRKHNVWSAMVERRRHQLLQDTRLVSMTGLPALLASTKLSEIQAAVEKLEARRDTADGSRCLCARTLLKTAAERAQTLCRALNSELPCVWPLLQAAVDDSTKLVEGRCAAAGPRSHDVHAPHHLLPAHAGVTHLGLTNAVPEHKRRRPVLAGSSIRCSCAASTSSRRPRLGARPPRRGSSFAT